MEETGYREGALIVRILVVEDEIELAAYLKRGLEREGFTVEPASDWRLSAPLPALMAVMLRSSTRPGEPPLK